MHLATATSSSASIHAASKVKTQSPFRRMMRRLLRHHSAQIGMALLGFVVFVAIFADFIAPHSYEDQIRIPGTTTRYAPCVHILGGCDADKPESLFGLDSNRRDVFSRVIYGSRLSLQIGFVTTGFAILIGTLLGAIAGYVGGWLDNIIMRIMDVLLAFPSLLLAIAIVTVLGNGLINTLLAVGIVSIPVYARIVRAAVLSIRELDFISASTALGASKIRILFTRLLPNSLTPIIVQGTLGIATTILEAAGLSFLGLGAQPPLPEWGLMLGDERASVFSAPHLLIFPGIAIIITVLAFNLLGDGLRDALDARRA
jgi:ABC-type dipeptide/oligopeptide/nickel transport system permease subunit